MPTISNDYELSKFFSKDNSQDPTELDLLSKEKLKWICRFGHKWTASPFQITQEGKTCPSCKQRITLIKKNGSLASKHPELSLFWDKKLNGDISPDEVTPRSLYKAWWTCDAGHESYLCTAANRGNGKGCPKCAMDNFVGSRERKKISEGNAFSITYPELLEDWDYEKNIGLDPNHILPGSDIRAWWLCKKRHSWRTSIKHRTLRNTGCPLCSKQTSRIDVRLYTEFKTIFPDAVIRKKFGKYELDVFIPSLSLGIEFDGGIFHKDRFAKDLEKNEIFRKMDITVGRVREEGLPRTSELDVYFDNYYNEFSLVRKALDIVRKFASSDQKKEIDAYILEEKFQGNTEYQQLVAALPNPILGQSLADASPDLIKEWHPVKNGELTPKNVYKSSSDKVWWKCANGHDYEMTVNKRANGRNCPYCSGQRTAIENSISQLKPWLIDEFHPTKNDDLTHETVTAKSNRKIWWKCKNGHEWQAPPNKRKSPEETGGTCPKCRSFGFVYPELAKEFDEEKNGCSVYEIVEKSGKKVWWKCEQGHSYQRVVRVHPTVKKRCPFCSRGR